jgi:uncharacterized protein YukE
VGRCDKFHENFEQAKKTMTNFTDLLIAIQKDLNDIATKFRTTDGQ